MAVKRGRPPVDYQTTQVRLGIELVHVFRQLAGLSGRPLTEAINEIMLPLARDELAKRLGVESKSLAKILSKGGENGSLK